MVNGLFDVLPLLPEAERKRTTDALRLTLDKWSSAGVPFALLHGHNLTNGPELLNSGPAAANYLLDYEHTGSTDSLRLVDALCDR